LTFFQEFIQPVKPAVLSRNSVRNRSKCPVSYARSHRIGFCKLRVYKLSLKNAAESLQCVVQTELQINIGYAFVCFIKYWSTVNPLLRSSLKKFPEFAGIIYWNCCMREMSVS